jgi:hypothetical protein
MRIPGLSQEQGCRSESWTLGLWSWTIQHLRPMDKFVEVAMVICRILLWSCSPSWGRLFQVMGSRPNCISRRIYDLRLFRCAQISLKTLATLHGDSVPVLPPIHHLGDPGEAMANRFCLSTKCCFRQAVLFKPNCLYNKLLDRATLQLPG